MKNKILKFKEFLNEGKKESESIADLFISGGENIKLYNYTIKDIENRGNEFVSIVYQHPSHPAGEYPGGNSYGIANVASTNVIGINEENISNIRSTYTNTLATKVFTI